MNWTTLGEQGFLSGLWSPYIRSYSPFRLNIVSLLPLQCISCVPFIFLPSLQISSLPMIMASAGSFSYGGFHTSDIDIPTDNEPLAMEMQVDTENLRNDFAMELAEVKE
ncbi:unnamed protein product [Lactuca saligna]|uniref:Uncharacterized protein n=1 Tax=Lactuca saligna TaxID=75948 RepID=A0AA35YC57_LACSI|nr:unnamed protein product [Lactuca saligna]